MWSIGIKSGAITVLLLVVYSATLQLAGWGQSSWGNIEYILFVVGIYSAHYYFKRANGGLMTYREGLKLGLIVTGIVGFFIALSNYVQVRYIDPEMLPKLAEALRKGLEQRGLNDSTVTQVSNYIETSLHPSSFFWATMLLLGIFGTLITLVVTAFTRSKRS